ncbi:hypothetical protein WMY93_032635 [Mugilogobius chulae]|uniref:Uncharacterized protein n=1 Tax=Mugilogobius chulae TaxID=88201 RepID=A0AAW0MK80_9GOBI
MKGPALILLLIGISGCSAQNVFLESQQATQVLQRNKRANQLFEEVKPGNLERECLEEICDHEEAREVFEQTAPTEIFWTKYLDCNGTVLERNVDSIRLVRACLEGWCVIGKGVNYEGEINITKSGLVCQRWSGSYPHPIIREFNVTENPQLQENFCRNPNHQEEPWCYTKDPTVQKEACSVPKCGFGLNDNVPTNRDGSECKVCSVLQEQTQTGVVCALHYPKAPARPAVPAVQQQGSDEPGSPEPVWATPQYGSTPFASGSAPFSSGSRMHQSERRRSFKWQRSGRKMSSVDSDDDERLVVGGARPMTPLVLTSCWEGGFLCGGRDFLRAADAGGSDATTGQSVTADIVAIDVTEPKTCWCCGVRTKDLLVPGLEPKTCWCLEVRTKDLLVPGVRTKDLLVLREPKTCWCCGVRTKDLLGLGVRTKDLLVPGLEPKTCWCLGLEPKTCCCLGVRTKDLLERVSTVRRLSIDLCPNETL